MTAPAYSLALKTVLDETRNLNQNVEAFVFKQNGEVIAQNSEANPKTIQETIQFFNETASHVDAVGGFENLTVRGSNGQVNFTACMNGFYLATVSLGIADEKILFAYNRVLVPVIIKVVHELIKNGDLKDTSEAAKAALDEPKQEAATQEPVFVEPKMVEPVLPDAPVHQFMVEKIGGLLVASDTVRVDGGVIEGWSQLFPGKLIEQVTVESLKMKMVKCKFKPVKESRNPVKGIVQVPEKIMQALEVSKGELVMVKPVIEE